MADNEENTTAAAASTTAPSDAPAASSSSGDAGVDASASSSSKSAAAAAESSSSAPVKEKKEKKKKHKDKKEKKRKKDKKHKKDKHKSESSTSAAASAESDKKAEGEGATAAAAADAEMEEEEMEDEEEETEESESSSSSDEEDEEAELRDHEEEERRRQKKLRKKQRAKAGVEKKKKRKRREPGSKFLDVEVEVSSDEEVSADEDEGEDNDGFLKDLVVPDAEVEAEMGPRSRKRKRGKIIDAELDEDDYNLLKENLGMEVHTTNIDQDVDKSDDEDAGDRKRSRLKKGPIEKKIDFEELERQKREKEMAARLRKQKGEIDDYAMDEDDDAGFLAPEDDEAAHSSKKKHRDDSNMADFVEEDDTTAARGKARGEGGVSAKERERLEEFFGSVTAFFQTKRGAKVEDEEDSDGAYGDEEPAEEQVSEADSEDERIKQKRRQREAVSEAKVKAQKERENQLLETRHLDIPERLQARAKKRRQILAADGGDIDAERDTAEREEEAQWIFEQMYRQSSLSVVRSESALVPTIRSVLRYLQEDHLEVQFIATYRKEHWCGTEMAQDAVITEDELFKIDELDERWMELGTRKKKLTELLSEYQETAYVQNLHESESSSHPRSYQDYATPSSFTLNEWKRLLSSRELSGLLELDDVQDALTVLGMVEQSKKKRASQEKRELKEFERRERRERRAALIKERQEAFARRKEEREKRRAELAANAAETGADAPAEAEEEEELNLDDIDIKSEDEGDEDVEMADADEKQPRGARARLNRAKFHFLNQAWTVPGVPQLAASLGLNPAEFAENLQYNFLKVHPRDGVWNVDYLSEEAIKLQKAKNSDEVLNSARRYVAYLIATEPLVRRFVRKEFLQLVEIWTFPTAKGVRELDDTHEYSSVRRIESKPLNRMKEHPAQFLLMHQAEKDGFIRVEFRLPKNTEPTNRVASLSMEEPESNGITATLCQLFLSSSTSPDARLWNDERRKVIHDAMATFLIPLCEAHARSLLLKDAIEFVNDQIATRLTNTLRNQGFQPPPSAVAEEEEEESSRKKKKKKDRADPDNWRIFSLIVGDEKSPTYIAVLNRYGGVIDHACLHFLKSNVQPRNRPGETATEAERNQLARKKEDTRKFLELVQTHSPKLVVVDAANMDCRSFKEELATRTLSEYAGQIRVEFMDPELSRIYMNSARAELEFKEYPRNLRQAISMGRQALDPVAEFSGLYSGPIDAEQWSESANTSAQLMQSIETTTNQDEILKKDIVVAATNALQNDMLALSLHPLQRNIPTKLLLNTMQRVLVRMVNYSGVDINKIVQRPWLTGSIQFLTGLGPIKAKYLLDYVKKNNALTSRDELKNELLSGIDAKKSVSDFTAASAAAKGKNVPIFGPCLFRNVAGFIIIHRNTYMTDAKLHPLDETRIHPERYALAQQVALDALDVTAEVLEAQQVEKVEKALKKASRKEEDEEDLDYYDDAGEIDEYKKAAKDESRQKRIQEKVYLDMMKEYIKQAMEQSELIDQLSFEAFCKNEKDLELQGGEPYEPKMESLLQIASELKHPFSDVKQLLNVFASPSAHRLFYLLTGETSRTLREGLMLPVVINGIHPQAKGAYVRLDSNVRGFLAFRNVSDNAPRPPRREDVTDPQLEVENQMAWLKSRLTPGMSVNARILKLEKDKFMVELSTRSSDLNQATWIAGAGLRAAQQQEIERKFGRRTVEEVDEIEQALYFDDPYLFVGTHPEDAALLAAEAGPVKAEKRFRQRNITHTLFRNIGREEAIGELRDKPMGEVVVRPSTLGTNHLTLTWKVSDQEITSEAGQTEKGIYFNVDIKEEQKPNELEIGTRLIVKEGKYVYEDLDEIVARFITPMIRWVNDLTAHKNFRFGNEAEIHGILFAEKQQDRSKFPYALHFATSAKRVGAFQFSFLPNADVKSSSFVVVPEGYFYHERTYSNVNSLLAAIKTEMSSKVGVAPPAGSQKVAAAGSRSSRSGTEKKSSTSLPPYAGAANAAPASSSSSRPPYAAAASSSSSSGARPPYAAAASSAPPSRPYDSRPPYGAPQPYGAAPYGGAPPQQYPPQPYGYAAPPPQGYYQQPPPQSAASGYVHPARAGIVPSGYPQQPPQQYGGGYPPQQQPPRDGPRRSRWTGSAPGSNARDDEMEM